MSRATPATIALFEAIMKAKPHPEQGFRSCLGILSLVKSYGPERIEAAARRGAVPAAGIPTYVIRPDQPPLRAPRTAGRPPHGPPAGGVFTSVPYTSNDSSLYILPSVIGTAGACAK